MLFLKIPDSFMQKSPNGRAGHKIRKFARSQSKLFGQTGLGWSRGGNHGYRGGRRGRSNVLCCPFIIEKHEVAKHPKLLHSEVFRLLRKLTFKIELSSILIKNKLKCEIMSKKVEILNSICDNKCFKCTEDQTQLENWKLILCQLVGGQVYDVVMGVVLGVLGDGSGDLKTYVSRLPCFFLRSKKVRSSYFFGVYVWSVLATIFTLPSPPFFFLFLYGKHTQLSSGFIEQV